MLAIDTNVLVRALTGDDPVQAARVGALMAKSRIFVLTTVLLESAWVLTSLYGYAPSQVIAGLKAFAGLRSVILQEPERVGRALDWAGEGMDFADALHLAGADECEAFVSFDARMRKSAARLGAPVVRSP